MCLPSGEIKDRFLLIDDSIDVEMIDIDNELSLKARHEELASVYKKMEDLENRS